MLKNQFYHDYQKDLRKARATVRGYTHYFWALLRQDTSQSIIHHHALIGKQLYNPVDFKIMRPELKKHPVFIAGKSILDGVLAALLSSTIIDSPEGQIAFGVFVGGVEVVFRGIMANSSDKE